MMSKIKKIYTNYQEKQQLSRICAKVESFGRFDTSLFCRHIAIDLAQNLMWCDEPQINYKETTWDEANNYAKELRTGGYSDWRLPTLDELVSLQKLYSKGYPKYPLFLHWHDKQHDFRWTFRRYRTEDSDMAFSVNLKNGIVLDFDVESEFGVCFVRKLNADIIRNIQNK